MSAITADRLRELLHYNPETGAFTWRVNRMCGRGNKQIAARAGDVAGFLKSGRYIALCIDDHEYLRGGDLNGTCHHLVNEKKFAWVK